MEGLSGVDEPVLLCQEIVRLSNGGTSVAYGVLVDDERVEQTFEALMGTLKAARKRGLIDFEGELLLKGQHDSVLVKLTSRGEAAPSKEFSNEVAAAEFSNEVAAAESSNEVAAAEFSNEVAAADTEVFSNEVAGATSLSEAAPAPPTFTMAPGHLGSSPAESEPPPQCYVGGPPAETMAPMAADTAEFSNAPVESEVDAAAFSNDAAAEFSSAAPAPSVAAAEPGPEFSNEVAAEAEAAAPAPSPPMGTVAFSPPSEIFSNDVAETVASQAAAPPAATIPPAQAAGYSEEQSAPRAPSPDGDKKWTVDTSYIDRRTKDLANLEVRRDNQDDDATAAAGTGQRSSVTAATGAKTKDGKWEVDTGYIDYRTKDPNRLEARRTQDASAAPEPQQTGGGGVSATTKKDTEGKWTVDVSYINHRTSVVDNLDKNVSEDKNKSNYADPAEKKYPYEELKGNARPKDVDPAKREAYLSDAEFLAVFGMDAAALLKLPKWKQHKLKKDKDIF